LIDYGFSLNVAKWNDIPYIWNCLILHGKIGSNLHGLYQLWIPSNGNYSTNFRTYFDKMDLSTFYLYPTEMGYFANEKLSSD